MTLLLLILISKYLQNLFKKNLLLFLIFFSTAISALAQTKTFTDSIEIKTAELFKSKHWNELISFGESKLRNGFENYFLRVAMGKAYYKIKNYFKAISNFEKAVELSYSDPEIVKYLYKLYDYTGRYEDKNYFYYDLSERMKNRYKPLENSFMEDIHFEFSKSFTNDFNKNSSAKINTVTDSSYLEQILNGDESFFNVGFTQLPFRWVGVTYDYSYLKISKRKEVKFNTELFSDSYNQYQNRFYNKYDIRISTGFIVSPAGHYLSVKDNTIYAESDSTSYYVSRQEKFSDEFILSLELVKYFLIYKIGINGSFSYLNKLHQSQFGLNVKCYPFGKIDFYSITSAVLHNQNNISNLIFSQSFGGIIYKKLSGNINVSFGKANNYNEQNGFIVYNNPDALTTKFKAGLKYTFPYNLTIDLIYKYRNYGKNFRKVNYDSHSVGIGFNFGF